MNNSTPRPKPIHVTREQIQETDAFKKATKMIQKLTLNRTNFRCIQHGVNVVSNIGFEKWDQQTQSSWINREIIQELVKNRKNEN